MAMLKGLMGGAAGAAVYTAYRDADTLFNSKDLATGVYDYWQKKGAANIAEVSRLQKNVEDLQHALLKSLHDRQQPTVIVAGSNGKSGWSTAGGVVLVVGGVALYLRFVKGWKLTDLMYVTRSSLSSLTENMKQGMDHMRAQLEAKAADLMERMAILGSKQEELLDAQGQLGDELAAVGGKVSLVSDQVGFSNHAILLLCGALSEMAKRVGISNGKYVKELEHLSRVATSGLPHTSPVAGMPLLPGVGLEAHHSVGGVQQPPLPAPPAAAVGGAPGPNPAVFAAGLVGSSSADGSRRPSSAAAGGRGLSEPQTSFGVSKADDVWGSSVSRVGVNAWGSSR